MPSELDRYRLVNRLHLVPSYMSLGLPPEVFHDGRNIARRGFDAVLSGPSDVLWLFKGEDFIGYDLRTDQIVQEMTPIAGAWAADTLPESFKFGLDAACWGGPDSSWMLYLFRDGEFVELHGDGTDLRTWQVASEPAPLTGQWLRRPGIERRRGIDFGPATLLYGLRSDKDCVHFFGHGGSYARHNFMTGGLDDGPVPLGERFELPEAFRTRIDVAFYGAGDESEHIFFFSGFQYAEYDIRQRRLLAHGTIEKRFPALALFTARPQLFLVEDYTLDTYIGPLRLGGLAGSIAVLPQSRKTSVVVTQITTSASTALKQNLLESQSRSAIEDFYKKVEDTSEQEASTDSYQYRLRAQFHGEAEANSLWGGEVNAQVAVDGGSDQQRERLAESAFKSIASQTRESTHTVNQRVMSAEEAQAVTQSVFSKETFELSNTSAHTRQVEFYELLQPFTTLLLLNNVRAAYSDGTSKPTIFALSDLKRRLSDLLAEPEKADPLLDYIRHELSRIQASSGDMRAIISRDSPNLEADSRVKSTFAFAETEPPQTVEVAGIIKAVKDDWVQPTYQTRPIDIAPAEDDAQPLMITNTTAQPGASSIAMSP